MWWQRVHLLYMESIKRTVEYINWKLAETKEGSCMLLEMHILMTPLSCFPAWSVAGFTYECTGIIYKDRKYASTKHTNEQDHIWRSCSLRNIWKMRFRWSAVTWRVQSWRASQWSMKKKRRGQERIYSVLLKIA